MTDMSVGLLLVLLGFANYAATSDIPLPTPPQLEWSSWELGALVTYNMATYVAGDGCEFPGKGVPPPSLFSPSKINTDQWAAAFQAFGAKYAVLVAKHNCGFALWPSKVHFPEFKFVYNYTVAQSKSPDNDIVESFVKSCRSHGIQPGFYYSVVTNYYLNVHGGEVQTSHLMPGMANVTQDQYLQIVSAQLTELWSQYGQLGEVWFDGGYQHDIKGNLTSMLEKLQPNATAFNGQGVSKNAIRWIGTEAGRAPDPNWSTGESGGGDSDSSVWCPAECDTTLQNHDRWFYSSSEGIRSLDELIDVYHQTVGHNGNLLLDFSPDTNGLIPDNHIARYKELGDFIRTCYGKPINATKGVGPVLTIMINPPTTIDRIVLQEDQSQGQRVRTYNVSISTMSGLSASTVNGTSIGNKKIDLLPAPVQKVNKVEFRGITGIGTPILNHFGVYYCAG
ncbi:uncharacterized protein LOC134184152 isoform X2 [Corticium candelabrum]|uniref:uncharacterized protein LOC134184152 isoform X2 n=1 Tax=Corticium candelabrum TaxID=121492 RepID=UPI002E3736A1|nr:uncharacterized protein LOC134184152 isoform X2 [Corticium candelabrum]